MKKLNILLTVSFIVGLIISLYTLYGLPSDLVRQHIIDLTQQPQVQSALSSLYVTTGATFLIGISAVVGLWLGQRKATAVAVSERSGNNTSDLVPGQNTPEAQDTMYIEGMAEIVEDENDETVAFTKALSRVCHHIEASQAVAYRVKQAESYAFVELFASFAYHVPEGEIVTYRLGEGLVGQVAKQGECVIIDTVPEGYLEILSGLGKASPTHLMILPIKHEGQVVGVVEIASFRQFSDQQKDGVQEAFARLALKLSNSDNVSLAEPTS